MLISNVGDTRKEYDEKMQKRLSKCSGGCLFGFDHAEDDGKKSNAHFIADLYTGDPNINPPYARYIIFRLGNIQHKAAVVITGDYEKEKGQSFAFPTHKPIIVLRDPPGGLSSAIYENMKTTLKMRSTSGVTTISNKFALKMENVGGGEIDLCAGGGMGAILLGCKEPLKINLLMNTLGVEENVGGITQHDEEEESSQFTTTWSYTTSEDPWLAGSMSDVFVVPNLNVEFSEVWTVEWDETACRVIEEADPTNSIRLPFRTVFNLDEGKSSLAFYNRYHVIYSKLPDLYRSTRNVKIEKDKCQCGVNDEIMSGCECDTINAQLESLKDGVADWHEALSSADQDAAAASASDNSILDWFEKARENPLSSVPVDLQISAQSSALAPPELTSSATPLDTPMLPKDKIKTPDKIQRIQFSGGGNTFEMHMSKEKVESRLGKASDCWQGCNVETETNLQGPGLEDLEQESFKNGIRFGFTALDFTVHYEHESTKTTEKDEETTIGFVLGDDDPGDEFVVDLFFDKKYGTIIFKTALGISKCPHEEGTAPIERPLLRVSRFPPQHVLPNEEMIFEIKMENEGVGNETLFTLYVKEADNKNGLALIVDGNPLIDSREYSNIKQQTTYTKTIAILRGYRGYKNKYIDLTFESACEDGDSMLNDLTTSSFGSTVSSTIGLFNKLEGGDGEDVTKFIEFVEPCPKVEWAGVLNRDRTFVVNTESDTQKYLLVTAFNPDYSKGPFSAMTSGRLESVTLSYRRKGDFHWSDAFDQANKVLDFSCDCDEEDSYGYVSMKWWLEGKVLPGIYEIKLGTRCNQLGGPDNIDMFDASILTGVIDLTHPEQYGKVLPLHDHMIIGEEISVMFTEEIDCGTPYTFDIELMIGDISYDKDDLHVVCEGRMIGLQLDPSYIDIEQAMGKVLRVNIGKILPESDAHVYDTNGNPLEDNLIFEKTIADLNLDEASISFKISVSDIECEDTVVEPYSDELKGKISSMLETDISRIEIDDVDCLDSTDLLATIRLLPPGRRFLRSENLERDDARDDALPTNLFYKLQRISKERKTRRELSENKGEEGTHMSSFTVSNLKIAPCSADLKKFKTVNPSLMKEEEELKNYLAQSLGKRLAKPQEKTNVEEDHKMYGAMKAMQETYEKAAIQMQNREDKHEKEMQEMKHMYEKMIELQDYKQDPHGMQTMIIALAVITFIGTGVTVVSYYGIMPL